MIRLKYTFMNADNRLSWNEALIDADTIEEALQSLKKTLPAFALKRLVEMRAFQVIPYSSAIGYNEFQMPDHFKLIPKFIEANK